MKLDWTYNAETRKARTDITLNLYYESLLGGQTIHKYVNGELVQTFHKFGPDKKFTGFVGKGDPLHGMPATNETYQTDEWIPELLSLAELYPEIVGENLNGWDKGFLNEAGEIIDVGVQRGLGVISEELPISINRMGVPGSIQEWWGWEVIAYTEEDVDENCWGRGTVWRRNKETGKIVRVGNTQPQIACCVFPMMHGPFEVDESDIEEHGGIKDVPVWIK